MNFELFEDDLDESELWDAEIGTPTVFPVQESPHNYNFQGLNVSFPYEAYESQDLMMSHMVAALERSENCLLESPTGTGKTAAILCGLLAWQKQVEERQKNGEGWPSKVDEATAKAGCTCGFTPTDCCDYEIKTEKVESKFQVATITLQLFKFEFVEIEIPDSDNQAPNTDVPMPSPKKRKATVRQLKAIPDLERKLSKVCRFCIRTHCKPDCVPIIYYATRTHSQIKQVVAQLKPTAYSHVPMTILASRTHTCLNLDAVKAEKINDECQTLRKNYQRNIKFLKENPTATQGPHTQCCRFVSYSENGGDFKEFSLRHQAAWDIEDLNYFSRRKLCCSYYGTKILKEKAKIVFCTYNHLLHGGIRNMSKIDLTNSVVVFDEAHNIEDICREVSSLFIKQKYIQTKVIPEFEKAFENPEEIPPGVSSVLNSLLNFFRILNSWFDTHSESIIIERNAKENYKPFSDADIIQEFSSVTLTRENIRKYFDEWQILSEAVEKKENFIMNDSSAVPVQNDGNEGTHEENGFKFSVTIIRYIGNLFWKFNSISEKSSGQLATNDYKAAFVKRMSFENGPVENEFSYICLNPAISFEPLRNRSHSVIVTSGTLSPLESFSSELDTKFPNPLSAPHVIPADNVFSAVITHGPNARTLCFNKKGQDDKQNQRELGECIVNICKIVPNGVLVLLPSYGWMTKLKQLWNIYPQSDPILKQLERIKDVFFEVSKDKDLFVRNMKDFKSSALSKGSVLFAVFRGKVSEGVDFRDKQARAVVTVGIPFTNMSSPGIVFKKEYNDSSKVKDPSRGLLSGNQWYSSQAFRALNQGFGRCVRHKKDWGCLILIDNRMEQEYNKNKLSKWVSRSLKSFSNFGDLEKSLSEFIQYKENNSEDNSQDMTDDNRTSETDQQSLVSRPLSRPTQIMSTQDIHDVTTQQISTQPYLRPQGQMGLNGHLGQIGSPVVQSNNLQFSSPQSEMASRLQQDMQIASPAPRRSLRF